MVDREAPWLELSVRTDGDSLILRQADSERSTFHLSVEHPAGFGWGEARSILIEVPESLLSALHRQGGLSPAIFLDIERPLQLLPIEDLLAAALEGTGYWVGTFRFVRLARRKWLRRQGFRLPLRIAGLDHWQRRIDGLVDSTWWAREAFESGALATGLPGLGGSPVDILISGTENLGHARWAAGRGGPAQRPRLVVVVDEGFSPLAPLKLVNWRLPAGSSMLVLRTPVGSADDVMGRFLEEVTHDLSFDLLAAAMAQAGARPLLFSDPAAIHDLRMCDAASAMIDQIAALNRSVFSDTPRKLLESLNDAQARSALTEAGEVGRKASRLIEDARQTSIGFLRESAGFLPLSQTRSMLNEARPAVERTQEILASVNFRDTVVEIESAQERVVNVTLQRQSFGSGLPPMVDPHELLVRHEPYRLFVEVGEPAAGTLVVGKPPSLDPLLPALDDGERHILHVAVYSSDFEVRPPAVPGEIVGAVPAAGPPGGPGQDFVVMQRLELPRIGASLPLEFSVIPRALGTEAEARIVVYYDLSPDDPSSDGGPYRNHLLQSFRLTARLEADEGAEVGPQIRVVLDSTQSERFSNLPALKPRLLSLALNDGPGEGTHRLMVKKEGAAASVQFTEGQMEKALARIRKLLTELSWDDSGTGPRFQGAGSNGSELPEDFLAAVKQLAAGGRALLSALTEGAAPSLVPAILKPVREMTDEVIQIIRLNHSYYFPWTLIYDFKLPRPDAPVCEGFRRTHPDGTPFSCRDCLEKCLHPDKSEAYCPYGFWGMRHRIEQLVGGITAREAPLTLEPLRDDALHVAVGLEGGQLALLGQRLAEALGSNAGWLTLASADEDLLTRLASPARRPAVLLVASHCETTQGLFEGVRIKLPGEDRWLEPRHLDDALIDDGPWSQPQPLIMLVACGSAAAELASLSNFVAAFLNAGAAAVVGTEAVIFEDLAVEFAVKVTPRMLEGASLGEAILSFRRELMRKGQPLGFLFTAFGSADLTAAIPKRPALLEVM